MADQSNLSATLPTTTIPAVTSTDVTEIQSHAFTTYDLVTGQIGSQGTVPLVSMVQSQVQTGQGIVLDDQAPDHMEYYRDVVKNVWVKRDTTPGSAYVYNWSSHTWVDPRDIATLQADQIVVINASFDTAAAALTAGYPAAEQATWSYQQAEALAWQADNTVATPYLDSIAAARGIDPATLRQKTLENVLAFKTASAELVGTRQKLRDQILAATDPAVILTIFWPATTTASASTTTASS